MGHNHSHDHNNNNSTGNITVAFWLNTGFALVGGQCEYKHLSN